MTDAELVTLAEQIRDETIDKANTKVRVYTILAALIAEKFRNDDFEEHLLDANAHATAITNAVNEAYANLVASAPATLDTLNELAAALGDDPDFAATIINLLAAKRAITNAPVALVDGASMDLTGPRHTLTTASAAREFSISYPGDSIILEIILNATISVFTFPGAALCVVEGVASGNNTASVSGTSGDKYVIAIEKIGASYNVACKNFGQ
jgi:hypothetical protein